MQVGLSDLTPAAAGNSVCAFVHGFEPYFYVEAPPAFGPDDCDSLRAQLNVSTLITLSCTIAQNALVTHTCIMASHMTSLHL